MDKRFIVAIVLVFVILLLWPLIFSARKRAPDSRTREAQKVEQEGIKEEGQGEAKEKAGKEEITEEPSKADQKLTLEETKIKVQTPLYEVQLTKEGAQAVNWKLTDYHRRIKDSEGEYVDLIPQDSDRALGKNWLGIKFDDPNMQDMKWSPNKELLDVNANGQDFIKFDCASPEGIEISKEITFYHDKYYVDVDVIFRNTSPEEKKLKGYKLQWGPSIAKDEILKDVELAKEGPIALLKTGNKPIKHWKQNKPGGCSCFGGSYEQLPVSGDPVSWVGFASKYFAAVLIPRSELAVNTYEIKTPDGQGATSSKIWDQWGRTTTVALVQPEFSIPARKGEVNGEVKHEFRVYVGPKKWDILRGIKRAEDSEENLGLGKIVDFGLFSPLGKATLWLLKVFYRVSKNYGVAIIFLTILIKILYFPLTQKSMKSMKKMQDLAPKITALKERHRDDPQRLQKETMKLYKQHGVNPMGGCLPLLFQMPVFWALFTTLRNAVELRGAMFIPGWITDLSLPDTVAAIGGFPIRILPILMTGSMLAQQLMSGTKSQAQGSKMMAFMPLIFAFIFYSMPSGLVLYWFCNNILAIGHQYLIKNRQDTGPEEQREETGGKNRNNRKEK